MNIDSICHVLLIVGLANGAPILAARILSTHLSTPIDRGRLAPDGYAWLGQGKTWRGIISAYLLALPAALWLEYPVITSVYIIGLSMCGDLISSFIKRRLAMPSSSRAFLLDQIPEAGLPVVYLWGTGQLTILDALWIVLLFIVAEVGLSKILYKLHIRKRPY